MNESNIVSDAFSIALVVCISILVILVLIAITIILKERKKDSAPKGSETLKNSESINHEKQKSYSKHSVLEFLEFEKIEDNMIVQKNGKRFLMALECQGVNYDLMSKIEKVSVEEGFQQFLNTLKHPIQIYIQTRSVNLESSIQEYKEKVKDLKNKYDRIFNEYSSMKQSDLYSKEEIDKQFVELTKQKNLLEYGQDIIQNTEKMSLNKSVLNKRYFIIVPYFAEEDEKYGYDEIRGMAFSELYTKAQSLSRILSSCSVSAKILNSEDLAELLYVSYNRDEAEIFSIEKAIRAGYDEMYSTAPNVLEKKAKMLDEKINQEAIELANQSIIKAKSRIAQKVKEKENNMDDLVAKMAEMILEENKAVIGEEVGEEAIKEVTKKRKKTVKGENKDENQKTTRKQ